jgi:hypothetical protein
MPDSQASRFHLSPAQQLVLTDEYGSDASPFFSAGWQRCERSALGNTCPAVCRACIAE